MHTMRINRNYRGNLDGYVKKYVTNVLLDELDEMVLRRVSVLFDHVTCKEILDDAMPVVTIAHLRSYPPTVRLTINLDSYDKYSDMRELFRDIYMVKDVTLKEMKEA